MMPKSIQIISHTTHSRRVEKQGMGEIANAQKLQTLLIKQGYSVEKIIDIFELFGGGLEGAQNICKITMLNGFLAQEGLDLIKNFNMDCIDDVWDIFWPLKEKIAALFVLTWDFNLAAFLGSGIHEHFPTISKCYCFQPQDIIFPKLFRSSHLIVTESLLGNILAIKAGIPPWKIVYLPHHYPDDIDKYISKNNRQYLHDLSRRLNKKMIINDTTVVIGAFGRFQCRKNIEYLIEAVAELSATMPHIILVIKGDIDPSADMYDNKEYSKQLLEIFARYIESDWLFWDRSHTAFPDVLEEYNSCDILVNLSGAESASNSVVEFMALKKPCLVLNASTNPYLFKDGVIMIDTQEGMARGKLFFYRPKLDDLVQKLAILVQDATLRQRLGEQAGEIATQRFAPELTIQRMPLVLEAANCFFHDKNTEKIQIELQHLYQQDLNLYGLSKYY